MSKVTKIAVEDNNVVAAAKEYVTNGLRVIQWQGDKSKGPREEGWNKPENAINNPKQVKQGIHGIGLAHLYSHTMALDIDNLDLARKYFSKHNIDLMHLLATGIRISSGRPGRAKLIYYIPEDINPADLLTINDQDNGFELRCATKNGMTVQDVLPPTIHPVTGKPYEWKGPDERPDQWQYIPMAPLPLLEHWYSRLKESKSLKHNDKYNDMLEPIVRDALMCIDPDISYADWLAIGMALSLNGLGELWDEWSSQGSKYSPGDCEARLLGFQHRGENLATIGTIFHHAREAGWSASAMFEAQVQWVLDNVSVYAEVIERVAHLCSASHPSKGDESQANAKIKKQFKGVTKQDVKGDLETAKKKINSTGKEDNGSLELTHAEIAHLLKAQYANAIVTDGSLWVYKDNYWALIPDSTIRCEVGDRFKTQMRCMRGSDYSQICRHVLDTDVEIAWFDNAPIGLATDSGFYAIKADGTICIEQNAPEHRQRFIAPVKPAAGTMPKFWALLSGMSNTKTQALLLQEFIGATLFGIAHKYQKAMLLYGETATGKSVLIKLMERIIGRDRCSNIAPQKFGEEYWRAQLATSMLNHVTELPDGVDISSPEFKQILGADTITGRHPGGRPFQFRCTTANVFSSNTLPTTEEANEAFWRRWVITKWVHKPAKLVIGFEDEIFDEELPAILHWAMEGVQRLIVKGAYTETEDGMQTMGIWQQRFNPVRYCVEAEDSPFIKGDDKWVSFPDFTRALSEWCRENDRKFPGRNKSIDMARQVFEVSKHGAQQAKGFKGIGLIQMGY